jgi:hypothetical protein
MKFLMPQPVGKPPGPQAGVFGGLTTILISWTQVHPSAGWIRGEPPPHQRLRGGQQGWHLGNIGTPGAALITEPRRGEGGDCKGGES